MRIGRTVIIPAIIALSAAGSIATVSAVPVAAAHPSTISASASGSAKPLLLYRG